MKQPRKDGYPIPGYNGHTHDAAHCPRCGAEDIILLARILSGQRIGVCHNCAENFIVEPEATP